MPDFARPLKALLFIYGSAFVFAAFSLWLGADEQGVRPQLALLWLAGSAVLLWAALMLARPKPSEFPQRTRFTAAEYMLAALVVSAGLVLFIHPGWYLSVQAPSGFMALLWGVGWVAGWLGPIAIAVLVLLLAHWFGITLYLDYRQAWWRCQGERLAQALADELRPQLSQSQYLGAKDTQWVARKMAQWVGNNARGRFSLGLPASRLQVSAQATHAQRPEVQETTQQKIHIMVTIAPIAEASTTDGDATDTASGAESRASEELEINIWI